MSILVSTRTAAVEVVLKAIIIALVVMSGGVVAEQAYHVITKRHAYLNPGADPCNPQVGCTLKWALDMAVKHNGWPQEVADKLIEKQRSTAGEPYPVKRGQLFWMTGGYQIPKYYTNSVASFDASRMEPSTLWFVEMGNKTYYLIKVQVCGNWAGFDADAPTLVIDKGNSKIPYGPVPVGVCPPT